MKILIGLLSFFAIIGIIVMAIFFINAYKSKKEANNYIENCSKVKVGMSLKEVREVMGDSIWNSRNESPQLYFNYYDNNYELVYPTTIMASGSPTILFDNQTMKVNQVQCDID